MSMLRLARRAPRVIVWQMTLIALAADVWATPFTLSETIALTDSETQIFVSVQPFLPSPGPVNCLLFTCDLDNTDVVFFLATVDTALASSSLVQLSADILGLGFSDIRGAGSLADLTGVAPSDATVDGGGEVVFEFPSPFIQEGQSTEVLFVSYALGVVDPPNQTIGIAVKRAFSLPFGDTVSANLTPIPEPSTALLLVSGLVGIAWRRRRL